MNSINETPLREVPSVVLSVVESAGVVGIVVGLVVGVEPVGEFVAAVVSSSKYFSK